MTVNFLTQYHWSYLILFLGIIVEGEFIVLTAGFLAFLGILSLPLVYLTTILGVVVSDIFWYYLGYRFGEVFLKKIKIGSFHLINEKRMKYIKSHFTNGTAGRTLFIAKFLYGLAHLTYLLSGASRIEFKKFIRPAMTSSIIWSILVVTLGYVFGHSFSLLHKYTKDVGISLSIIIISILIIEYLIKKESKDKI